MEQHERRSNQILPPRDTDPLGIEEVRRRRQRSRRSWTVPMLVGAGVMVLGVFSLSTCGESDSGQVIEERIAVIGTPDVAAGPDAALGEGLLIPESNSSAELAGSAARLGEGPAAVTPALPLAAPMLPSAAPAEPVASRVAPAMPAAPPAAPAQAAPAAPAVAAPVAEVVAKAPPVPAPAAPATGFGANPPSGAFSVQLVSVRDPAATRSYWETTLTQYPELFAGLTPSVQRADLGAKGVYHRLRVGPFEDRASAMRTCDALKARGGSCLVVTN
jgi:cell division septation protein DedD